MTFFSQVKQKFLVVSEGEDIATETFLQAAREILPFLGTSMIDHACVQNLPHFRVNQEVMYNLFLLYM